ncbi:O-antigen ligase family protein [Candidatus Shapirobacteria bacterium]|nr:O-antigen ligase family protein [Candidatus Shapirobacteria bacterium]
MIQKLGRFFLTLTLLTIPFQLGKHFWFPFSYVWGLPVDYLAPTIYLVDIFLLITVFIFLLSILQKHSRNVRIYIPGMWRRSFLGLIFLNIAFALNPQVAFLGWLKILKIFLLAWLVFKEKAWVKKNLPKIIAFWLFTQSFFSLTQFFKQGSLGGWTYWLGERNFSLLTPGIAKIVFNNQIFLRSYATFSHPNSLAGFVLLALFLYFSFQSLKKPLAKITLFAGLICLFLSFSRTVWLTGLLVLFLPKAAKQPVAKKLIFVLLLGFLTTLAFLIFPNPLALTERFSLAKASLRIFLTRPFLGVGWDNFLVSLPNFWPFAKQAKIVLQPVHNLFLLILSQAGTAGLLLTFWGLSRVIKKKNFFWWLIILATGLFDHYWLTLNQNLLLLGVVLGLSF